ncbi:glycine cleavage system aminomethyltransferase GcvT [Mesorhizobium sp. CAU 1741]|uniref:glycine cleavage system aminomethyltransferase GcvT n=1 Tax=Mesorhizobium sp. CAU 1741 TaxID=3140366 RepID=UPI00325BFFBB
MADTETGELSNLPLKDLHEAAGARFGGFAGWSMPITYPLGVLKEHLHTREKAGLFDISHMKLFLLTGPDAAKALSRACPIEADALDESQSKYTFFLNDDAGIIDDLIVTRLGSARFMVVANAGNAAEDEAHLKAVAAEFDCAVEPLDRVFLALQGPAAEAALANAGLDLSHLTFMRGIEPRNGWFASRSGYTGEDGFEVAMPTGEAKAFAETLLEAKDVEWIGLAARDSLRLEAGLCLHGQDITPQTTPVDAGLMWAIPKSLRERGAFIGADALRAAIAAGPARRRVGLKPQGRQPVRAGAELYDGEGRLVGTVTSGGFGPSAGFPVAMGYLGADDVSAGRPIFAEVRGNRVPVDIHPLPFTQHRYRKG